ncbi:T9SS type A sorting domain-containing protein [Lacinutrix iliipiscaria]|uniref:T9SS type A sorting domain-containing protein n=1 Tax=Lacinutrix iliipiscaria TaxID=1230532 RepID=A0ABW5WLR0_9FLAO
MKKTTLKPTNNLTKRLAKYSALTVAIAGIADANGQIIHTDVDPDFVGTLQSTFDVDFDSNAVNDATILQTNFYAPGYSYIELMRAEAPVGNGIVANVVGAYTYGVNVPFGTPIGSTAAVASFGDMCQASGYTNSGFCGTTEDSYVGVAFDISGNTHYGWIRLAPGSSSENFTIVDFAYESTPGAPINAGQSLSVEDFEQAHNYVISFDDKQVTISSIVDEANYRIISLSGQVVINGNTTSETQVIDLSHLSSGIYIVEISDGNEQRIQRKKIAIQ